MKLRRTVWAVILVIVVAFWYGFFSLIYWLYEGAKHGRPW